MCLFFIMRNETGEYRARNLGQNFSRSSRSFHVDLGFSSGGWGSHVAKSKSLILWLLDHSCVDLDICTTGISNHNSVVASWHGQADFL